MILAPPDSGRTVARKDLLSVVLEERPKILVCFAPPGYGKTTFAWQLSTRYDRAMHCNIEDAGDEEAFALQLARALGDGITAGTALTGRARTAWGAPQQRAAMIIIDNVERLDNAALRLLRSCLDSRAGPELVILCSRRPLDELATNSLSPADIMTITEADLRLNLDETAQLFEPSLDPETLLRVDALTEGWPLALQLLRREYRRGRLAQLLAGSDEMLRTLNAYIGREIVEPLDRTHRDLFCAISLLAPCSVRDLAPLIGDASTVPAAMHELPFVRVDRDEVALHPLLHGYLANQCAEHRREAAEVISQRILDRGGDVYAAARVVLSTGDNHAAAALLERHATAAQLVALDTAELLTQLGHTTLLAHPVLWNASLVHRLFELSVHQWYDEAREVWESLPADAPIETVVAVGTTVLNVLVHRGEWEHADRFRTALVARCKGTGRPDHPLVRLSLTLADGWSNALRMEPFDLKTYTVAVAPLLVDEHVHALLLCDVVARVHGARGDRGAERRAYEEAILRARRSHVPVVLALCLEAAAHCAWFANESELFLTLVAELDALVADFPGLRAGVGHFLDCAGGVGLNAREGTERPATRACSLLIAAGLSNTAAERRALLDEALRTADGCRHPGK